MRVPFQVLENSWLFAIILILFSLTPSPALTALNSNDLKSIFDHWGLSPLQSKNRHRFEGAFEVGGEQKRNLLELRLWYENGRLRSGEAPSPQLYCQMAHNLIFGSAISRAAKTPIPLKSFFQTHSEIETVRLIYFLVRFTNKPRAVDPSTPRPQPNLRVDWQRQEEILPYLSYEISRNEWNKISSILGTNNINFYKFQDSFCSRILALAPRFRTDIGTLNSLKPSRMD